MILLTKSGIFSFTKDSSCWGDQYLIKSKRKQDLLKLLEALSWIEDKEIEGIDELDYRFAIKLRFNDLYTFLVHCLQEVDYSRLIDAVPHDTPLYDDILDFFLLMRKI